MHPLASFAVLAFALSCGQAPKKSQNPDNTGIKASNTGSGSNSSIPNYSNSDPDPYYFSIPVKVHSENNFTYDNVLNLTAAADAFSIQIDGCLSGYNGTITQSSTSIRVYKYDKNCLAKLTSFSYDNVDYQPSATHPFSTWEENDSAVFEDVLNAANTIDVKIITTFSSTILNTDTIYFRFSNIKKGSTTSGLLSAEITPKGGPTGQTATAPSFALFETEIVGLTAGQAGKFQFILECTDPIAGDSCKTQNMNNMSYILLEDTYGGSLVYQDAEDIFSGGATVVDTNTDKIDEGTNGTSNGGFITKSGPSVLTGPETLVSKPNMILIIQFAGAENAYQYFLVQITLEK